MALECSCLRPLFSLPFKQSYLWCLPKNVFFYSSQLSQKFNVQIQKISPTVNHLCPFKMTIFIKSHSLISRPLLASIQPHIHLGEMGLKYQSNYKRSCVKEIKRQDTIKAVRGNDVIKGVRRAIQDKRLKFHQAEERWKKNSKQIIADIKETRSKVREKMEEIIERENVWTVPNMLCVFRILMSPCLGYLILEQNFHLALGVLTVAGITDLLDGWIARTFDNQSSKLGTFLDPAADKILIATMFLTLTYAGIIPAPLTGLIITRDIVLVTAGFVIRYKSLPAPRTLSRYFDVTHATAQLAPTFISKINTMVQLLTVACTLAAPVFGYLNHTLLFSLWYL